MLKEVEIRMQKLCKFACQNGNARNIHVYALLSSFTALQTFYVVDTFVVDTFVVDTFVVDTYDVDTYDVDTYDVDTYDVDTFVVDTYDVDTYDVDTYVVDTHTRVSSCIMQWRESYLTKQQLYHKESYPIILCMHILQNRCPHLVCKGPRSAAKHTGHMYLVSSVGSNSAS